MQLFNWVLSVIGSLFGLFELTILGVPIYVFMIMAFVFTLLANFIHGRK